MSIAFSSETFIKTCGVVVFIRIKCLLYKPLRGILNIRLVMIIMVVMLYESNQPLTFNDRLFLEDTYILYAL